MYIFYGFDKEGNRIELPKHLTLQEAKEMGIVEIRPYNEAQTKIRTSSQIMREFFENMNKVFNPSEEV